MCGTLKKRVSISHNRKKNLAVVCTKFILEIDSHKPVKNWSNALSQVYKSTSYSFISSSIYLK